MKRSIILCGKTVEYTLSRKAVKNINVRIKADANIYVSANKAVSIKEIEHFLKEKESFIVNALVKFEGKQRQIFNYNDGETFYYLGFPCKLCIKSSEKNFYEFEDNVLTLYLKDTDDYAKREKIYFDFQRKKAIELITELCNNVYFNYQKYVPNFPEINFRRMKSCWGSCMPKKNKLTFNILLIEKPIECIEYVVHHEFTHFIHANHSEEFYNELKQQVPDWKERRKRLR